VQEEAPRPPTRSAQRNYAVGQGGLQAGRLQGRGRGTTRTPRAKGDKRGLSKLVAMTHAPKCEARSEAADQLGTFRSKKATAALKKLARGRFKDESRTPGIFSCSSRRAAGEGPRKAARLKTGGHNTH